MSVMNCGGGRIEVETASTRAERRKGLLGHESLDRGKGLLIPGCSCIHTFFMKFPIDAVYLDSSMTVLKVCEDVKPFRLRSCLRAASVLELASGEAARYGIAPGMKIEPVAGVGEKEET